MSGKLIVTDYNDKTISVMIDEKGRPLEFDVKSNSDYSVGDIFVGRVSNIVKNINGAFVEIFKGQNAYLNLKEDMNYIFINQKKDNKLKVGDEIVVQIEKEAIKAKEPVVTTRVNLTGKYAVLIFSKDIISVSQKITYKKRREELREIAAKYATDTYGFTIRTNAENAENEAIEKEIEFLIEKWKKISTTGSHSTLFAKLYSAPSTILANIRDGYDNEVDEIVTDNKEFFDIINSYRTDNLIEGSKLTLYDDEFPLKKLYRIEKIISDLKSEKVWLKSGGHLIIQPTEALTVIDVNSGKNISKKDKENETFKLNCEAAVEIAHQLRLRNISGIIIIDFVNMENPEHKTELMNNLDYVLKKDPIQTTLVDMTKLNLVEVTRKKIKKPIHEIFNEIN